jgi:1,4-dihydroxy-6-naphthoate synthase
MLRAGGALGRGVGPLIVTREALDDLAGKSIAIPGGRTTANLLLRLSQPSARLREMRYDRIMPAVAAGEVDAGLIIHESRFTYPDHGLRCFLDLGTWWEEATGELVPLGGIVARRDLGSDLLLRIQAMLRASLTYAWENPGATRTYVAQHAQEMDESVRQRHIDLYVNRYSLEVGPDGVRAAETLLRRGVEQGLFPPPREPLFLPDVHRT